MTASKFLVVVKRGFLFAFPGGCLPLFVPLILLSLLNGIAEAVFLIYLAPILSTGFDLGVNGPAEISGTLSSPFWLIIVTLSVPITRYVVTFYQYKTYSVIATVRSREAVQSILHSSTLVGLGREKNVRIFLVLHLKYLCEHLILPIYLTISNAIIGLILGVVFFNLITPAWAFGVAFIGLLYILFVRIYGRFISTRGATAAKAANQQGTLVDFFIGYQRELTLSGAQDNLAARISRADQVYFDAESKNQVSYATPKVVIEGVGLLILVALIVINSRDALASVLGTATVVGLAMQRLLPIAQSVYNCVGKIVSSVPRLDALDDLNGGWTRDHALSGLNANNVFQERDSEYKTVVVSRRNSEIADPLQRDSSSRLVLCTGCVYVLNWPSGYGKSTFFDKLLGFREADFDIFLDDGISVEQHPNLKGVSIYSSQYANRLAVSVSDFITFFSDDKRYPSIACASLMRRLGLAFLLTQPERLIDTLSGGEVARLKLVQAYLQSRRVTLLDEPFNGVDPPTAREMVKYIYENAPGRITVVSSHNLVPFDGRIYTDIGLDWGRKCSATS